MEGIYRRREPALGELAENHRGQGDHPDDCQHSYDHSAHAPTTGLCLSETLIKGLSRLVDVAAGGHRSTPNARAASGLLPEAELVHDHGTVGRLAHVVDR